MPDVRIITFNARGLRDVVKRRALFRFLHEHYPKHFVVLQETHSKPTDSGYWSAEWGAPVFFSHGSSTNECGVAVLSPRSVAGLCDITVEITDEVGRLLVLKLNYSRFRIFLCAIYAPTQRQGQQQLDFFVKVKEALDKISVDDVSDTILAGDFNIHLSALDVQNCRFRVTQAAGALGQLLNDLNLVDIWRDRFPNKRRYTWRRVNPVQQSRIDYFFVTKNLTHRSVVNRIEIKPGILSDHSLVNLELTVHGSDKGKGLYTFNNELLGDTQFIEWARLEMEKARSGIGIYTDAYDMGLKIEMLCGEIRVKAMQISRQETLKKRQESKLLMDELETCEQEIAQHSSEEAVVRYKALQDKINQIEQEKGKRAMIRSGARWLEAGEKPTRYFLKMNQKRGREKCISVLQTANGDLVTGNREILDHCSRYFERIHASRGECYDTSKYNSFMQTLRCPQLNENQKKSCEGDLDNQECLQALKGMLNNKAPSVSGFSKEFFLFFWAELGEMIVAYANNARKNGLFYITQRRGVLTLLPKKGNQKLIKNKRAICLLDIIYKIVAKAIANRLMLVIDKLIAQDQTGSIRGRYIGTNLRAVADVIEYCNLDHLQGIIMALDFQNAFNSVEHCFMYDVLRKFNFGEDLISWVKLLHTDSELTVINNGYTGNWFRPKRGLQQGSPASSLLFALCIEILAIKIRSCSDVSGISVDGKTFKLSLYCDDVTMFVRDANEADLAINIVREFGELSGLALNMDKCEFMWIGENKASSQFICDRAPAEKVKILGVWFSATQSCYKENMGRAEEKIKKTLEQWQQRDLTIKGKITVAKSLAVSQLVFLMTAICINKVTLARIQSLIMKFVWRGRPPKVSRKTLTMPISRGGLKLPDLEAMNRANRIAWIGRIIQLKEATFVQVLEKKMRLPLRDLVKMNFDGHWVTSRRIPQFYKEMLCWYKEICPTGVPVSGQDIRKQPMWHNAAVLQGKRGSLNTTLKIEKQVPLVDDFVDETGRMLSFADFGTRHITLRVNPLWYLAWCCAIPKEWKVKLAGSEPLTAQQRQEEPVITIKDKVVLLRLVKSSYFYGLLVPDVTPTAQARWVKEGIDFGSDWSAIHERSFRSTVSTKLQSLQYKVLHRFFPTKRYLCIRNVIGDPFCDSCGSIESIEHYFFSCEQNKRFWHDLAMKMNQKLPVGQHVSFTGNRVIFGYSNRPAIVNLFILVAKQCIVTQHFRDEVMNLCIFLSALRKVFDMEKTIVRDHGPKDKFQARWKPFITTGMELDF